MGKYRIKIFLSLFLLVQIFLFGRAGAFSAGVEKYYSQGLYPKLSFMQRSLFGFLPFSFGDILYTVLILLILYMLYKLIRSDHKGRWHWFLSLVSTVSVVYFCFYFFWGLNYSRQPLELQLGFVDAETLAAEARGTEAELREAELAIQAENALRTAELEAMSRFLLAEAKALQAALTAHDSLAVLIPYSNKEMFKMAPEGYAGVAEQWPQFAYSRASIKGSIYSLPLTYMGFAGYLNPLTGEAQVDLLLPKINVPVTTSHEMAHQLGIASEEEANFLGFLAAWKHQDPYFRYAAALFALRYTLSDLSRFNRGCFEELREEIPLGILKNFRESEVFWQQYENPLEPLFKLFYDNYLKYNQQAEGIKSYQRVTSLILAYYRQMGEDF